MCPLCESSEVGSGTDLLSGDSLSWGRAVGQQGCHRRREEEKEARLQHMKGARSIDLLSSPAEEPPVRLGVHVENVPTFSFIHARGARSL